MPTFNYPPQSTGHRLRLRERFAQARGLGMHDYEMLELLLTFAIVRKDVKPVAKALIERFGGVAGVMDATVFELRQVGGLGEASSTLIKLVKELCVRYLLEGLKKRDVLSSPQRVADFARMTLAGFPHEAFMIIYANVQNEILHHEILQEGTIDQVAVYPRRIIENALARHAAGLVLVHNHPSGHVDPSEEDKRLTQAICQSAKLMSIHVLDHLIVGRGGHFSFRERGLITMVN